MNYPNEPGYQRIDTSKKAAEAVSSKAKALKPRIIEAIKESGGGLTTYEISLELGITYHQAHPRVAELHTGGHIHDTGRRRTSPLSGMDIAVWNIGDDGGAGHIYTRKGKSYAMQNLLWKALEVLEHDPLLNSDLIKKIKEILE